MIWILNSITYNENKFLRFPSSEGIFPDNWLLDKYLNNNQCYDIDDMKYWIVLHTNILNVQDSLII